MLEVIICLHKDHLKNLEITVNQLYKIKKNIKIIVIANEFLRNQVKKINSKIEFIDEDNLIKDLNLKNVKIQLEKIIGNSKRAGWYFQQFLKMGYAKVTRSNQYLIWDADLILLKDIPMTEKERKIFYKKTEYHQAYFETMNKILGIGKIYEFSFICEFMIIKTEIMLELIEKIEKNTEIIGDNFFNKILNSISLDEIGFCGFSEFETYGTYTLKMHPEEYIVKEIKTWRGAGSFLSTISLNKNLLEKLSEKYSTFSMEIWSRKYKYFTKILENGYLLKILPLNILKVIIIMGNPNITIMKILDKLKSKY